MPQSRCHRTCGQIKSNPHPRASSCHIARKGETAGGGNPKRIVRYSDLPKGIERVKRYRGRSLPKEIFYCVKVFFVRGWGGQRDCFFDLSFLFSFFFFTLFFFFNFFIFPGCSYFSFFSANHTLLLGAELGAQAGDSEGWRMEDGGSCGGSSGGSRRCRRLRSALTRAGALRSSSAISPPDLLFILPLSLVLFWQKRKKPKQLRPHPRRPIPHLVRAGGIFPRDCGVFG